MSVLPVKGEVQQREAFAMEGTDLREEIKTSLGERVWPISFHLGRQPSVSGKKSSSCDLCQKAGRLSERPA